MAPRDEPWWEAGWMGCYALAASGCSLAVTADGSRTGMVSGRECSRAERACQSKCGGTWTRGERTLQGKPRQNSRDVYGWLSRPYADTSYRCLDSPPKTPVFGAFRPYPPKLCSRHDKILLARGPFS
jgi:hypothetical protein